MNEIYLVIVVVLIALAVSDLVVGVSNDAVNFLNSAIGSKVAPFKIIMLIASVGIILGAMFSNGMMEIARKGVFYPENFMFSEIMILFFAVMITDILLLDFFNTLGLPTSTTVSIVFELLGAAVAVALVKIGASGDSYSTLGTYINSANALLIISGILISIVVAFSVGTLVQYLSRLLFTFNYKKQMKYFGALWGGLSISIILFFIVVKGAKGSTIISGDTIDYIQSHSFTILLVSFVIMTAILQLLHALFNFNILKFVVLTGTFGLAMAFAGNDLVNFIGVPLAGLASYNAFMASGMSDPSAFSMGILGGEIKTDTYLLIIAGVVMVATLWLSKKAKTVTETEISLGRQDSGSEKFGSSLLARSIVRQSLNLNAFYVSILPDKMVKWTNERFKPLKPKSYSPDKDAPAFDLIRASVNLTVASVLISFATSLKLPLSTTYVTFMVAMGSSLSDKAWGRESAVYRITGVITVVGGWFFTAFMAFSAALLIALVASHGGIYAIIGFSVLTIVFLLRTHAFHKKKEKASKEARSFTAIGAQATASEIIENCNKRVNSTINLASTILTQAITGLITEDRKLLKDARHNVMKLTEKAKNIKAGIPETIRLLEANHVKESHKYIQIIDYLRELTRSVKSITEQAGEHVNNNHEPFTSIQKEEIEKIIAEFDSILSGMESAVKHKDFSTFDTIRQQQLDLETLINTYSQKQVERMSAGVSGSKSSLLFLNLLFESGNLVTDTIHMIKAQRVFNSRNET